MDCNVERRVLVTHGTVTWGTGEYTPGERIWETRLCGTTLFGRDGGTGICPSCMRGWTHPENYPTEKGREAIRAAGGIVPEPPLPEPNTPEARKLLWLDVPRSADSQARPDLTDLAPHERAICAAPRDDLVSALLAVVCAVEMGGDVRAALAAHGFAPAPQGAQTAGSRIVAALLYGEMAVTSGEETP